jgi:hypothetical protein
LFLLIINYLFPIPAFHSANFLSRSDKLSRVPGRGALLSFVYTPTPVIQYAVYTVHGTVPLTAHTHARVAVGFCSVGSGMRPRPSFALDFELHRHRARVPAAASENASVAVERRGTHGGHPGATVCPEDTAGRGPRRRRASSAWFLRSVLNCIFESELTTVLYGKLCTAHTTRDLPRSTSVLRRGDSR